MSAGQTSLSSEHMSAVQTCVSKYQLFRSQLANVSCSDVQTSVSKWQQFRSQHMPAVLASLSPCQLFRRPSAHTSCSDVPQLMPAVLRSHTTRFGFRPFNHNQSLLSIFSYN